MNLYLILLAAGDGRRFGGNKLLSEFHGKAMYRYIIEEIEKLPESLFAGKMIVTQYEQIGSDLKGMGYQVVENHESRLGISHSIHLALEAVSALKVDKKNEMESVPDDTAYCFAVCDQPYLKAETMKGLIDGWLESGRGLGCLCNMGELGNPAVFSSRYLDELLALTGDVGGKRVVRKHIDDLYLYEVDDGLELVDIDVKM